MRYRFQKPRRGREAPARLEREKGLSSGALEQKRKKKKKRTTVQVGGEEVKTRTATGGKWDDEERLPVLSRRSTSTDQKNEAGEIT